jgi:mRNA interferase RelE/StbE
MSYELVINKQARKALKSLSRINRNRITEKIVMLGRNPDDTSLDIKRLQGEPYYRLRVGQWRVIFDRNDELKIIAIEKIKPRGDVYK